MELQSFELRLLHITVYTIHNVQRTSEIMYNLCTNSMNDLGKSFSHILKYREISSLLNTYTKLWYHLPIAISIYQIVILFTTHHIHLSIYLFVYLSMDYLCKNTMYNLGFHGPSLCVWSENTYNFYRST